MHLLLRGIAPATAAKKIPNTQWSKRSRMQLALSLALPHLAPSNFASTTIALFKFYGYHYEFKPEDKKLPKKEKKKKQK